MATKIVHRGASIQFIKIDQVGTVYGCGVFERQSFLRCCVVQGLDKVICGLADGSFHYVSTVTGESYFHSEDYVPNMTCADVAADAVFIGNETNKVHTMYT